MLVTPPDLKVLTNIVCCVSGGIECWFCASLRVGMFVVLVADCTKWIGLQVEPRNGLAFWYWLYFYWLLHLHRRDSADLRLLDWRVVLRLIRRRSRGLCCLCLCCRVEGWRPVLHWRLYCFICYYNPFIYLCRYCTSSIPFLLLCFCFNCLYWFASIIILLQLLLYFWTLFALMLLYPLLLCRWCYFLNELGCVF